MASFELMFERVLTTTDAKMFALSSNFLWTLEIVTKTLASITVTVPPNGQMVVAGSDSDYTHYNAVRFAANTFTKEERIFTPGGRDIRAFSTVSDSTLRAYGLRL